MAPLPWMLYTTRWKTKKENFIADIYIFVINQKTPE
jgi:hypothetical protein